MINYKATTVLVTGAASGIGMSGRVIDQQMTDSVELARLKEIQHSLEVLGIERTY